MINGISLVLKWSNAATEREPLLRRLWFMFKNASICILTNNANESFPMLHLTFDWTPDAGAEPEGCPGWKLILLFSKDDLNRSKVMIKTFIMLQMISISDKYCSSELSIHQRNLKKLYSTVFNIIVIIIINVFWAKNSAWNHRNKLHFKIYSNRKQLF